MPPPVQKRFSQALYERGSRHYANRRYSGAGPTSMVCCQCFPLFCSLCVHRFTWGFFRQTQVVHSVFFSENFSLEEVYIPPYPIFFFFLINCNCNSRRNKQTPRPRYTGKAIAFEKRESLTLRRFWAKKNLVIDLTDHRGVLRYPPPPRPNFSLTKPLVLETSSRSYMLKTRCAPC